MMYEDNLCLRQFKLSDAEIIAGWPADEKTLNLWGAGRYQNFPIRDVDIIDQYSGILETEGFFPMTAYTREGTVGHLLIRTPDSEHPYFLRFGFIITAPEFRGRGYGRRLVMKAENFAFRFLGAEKVSLGVFEKNEKAVACYLSAGFVFTGEREDILIDGETMSCLEMEITADGYAAKKKKATEA